MAVIQGKESTLLSGCLILVSKEEELLMLKCSNMFIEYQMLKNTIRSVKFQVGFSEG